MLSVFAPDPSETPSVACMEDKICKGVYELSDSQWLADGDTLH